jgi:asparagine synthase (glutamine-hydrolysing)
MCGIAGMSGHVPDEKIIPSMLEVIKHRGPDSRGFFVSRGVHLGHCRLSINDLSERADQPFVDEKHEVAVVVNGEIYNYGDLKKTLVNAGYHFKSYSDTEVVLHGYMEYGHDFIRDLNGMFAIAIWDGRKKELLLVRDRLGIKPLYYAKTNNSFLFASEIKALAQYEGLDLALDLQSFAEYMAFENTFSNRTLNRDIKMVQPGEIIRFTPGDARIKREFFWKPVLGEQSLRVNGDVYEKYGCIIESSVRRHLLSDVPIGFYLSSGIDTSSVVYYSSMLLGRGLNTYTGGFGLSGFYDEAAAAGEIARQLGCSNHRIDIKPKDFIENIEDVLWHLDEPRVGMGSFSQYMVAKRAARDVKVILTGHGGDEFFAGYPVFKAIYGKRHTLELILKSSFRELMFAIYFIVYPRFRKEAAYFFPNIYPLKSLRHILLPGFMDSLNRETDALQELNALKFKCSDEYERLTLTYLKYYLPALFTVEDKISMAFSLESRTPLCDNEMLDFALSIPLAVKLTNQELKHIPRTAMRKKLPDFIFKLPKRGFPTPLRLWFKKDLKGFIREYILENLGYLDMFNSKMVKKIISSCTDSRINTPLDEIMAHKVWILLNLMIYFKNQDKRYRRI